MKSKSNALEAKLVDRYNRHLNYLRVSITDRCNLRCSYCVPRDRIPRLSHDDILRYEEILRIISVAIRLGINKVRVTGGEPLVRKGVYGFLKHLTALEGLQDISLTTNGVYLLPNLSRLQASGISRINVSLDTLQRKKYAEITGCDAFDRVWQSIEGAHAAGFHPIKINVVALRGINDDELEDMARLSLTYPFHIRFIEHMPMGPSALKDQPLLLVPEIKKRISGLGKLKPVPKTYADGPAQRYRFEHAAGEIGFIAALSRHFCNECNRLRLTASGQLRPCLLAEHEEDLKNPVRSGASDEQIAQIFLKAIQFKPSDHNLASGIPNQVGCSMRSIGG